MTIDIDNHNKKAWNLAAEQSLKWSVPCDRESIEKAKSGNFNIKLTATKYLPESWLENIKNKNILLVAGGGGQQAPILAAAGANVTLLDISDKQVELDRRVCSEFNLQVVFKIGSYTDMNAFQDETFDYIVNPVSNCFFKDLDVFWENASKLIKKNGSVLVGFINPVTFQFDFEKANLGEFVLKYPQPFSDLESLSDEEKRRFMREETPIEFGHSLSDQLGLPLRHGFSVTGFFEDGWGSEPDRPIENFMPQFIAAKFTKLTSGD
jgi:2-polyprenyl-3-methyl-5-hydroxy-6-metoxy-1,4-benzoquinol methylase